MPEISVTAVQLPPLRQDLALYPADHALDGSPCWHLHDPAANRFYELGWLAFEILSRWELGETELIAEAICQQTTLEALPDDVLALAQFLDRHFLFEAASAQDSQKLLTAVQLQKVHWAKWLLKNYLFFRVPLFAPEAFLNRAYPWVKPLFSPVLAWLMGGLALLGLFMVARQWDHFAHTFSAYQGWEMLLPFGIAISCAKVFHELGHALVAKHYGCKIPAMGVAFLVMWPVLYTDTNESWKLPSRKARFHIGIAGIAAEGCLAILATLAWVLLPDGTVRAAAFFLATTSWVMTLLLNISPFMRFDGYFLLSDFLHMPNLHQRAFALGQWWLREKLFGFGVPVPEQHEPAKQRFLIAFALATWAYRAVVFLGIAFLVYHAFFKLLGIVLLLVELGWFIVLPLLKELEVWWKARTAMAWNLQTRRSAFAVAMLFLLTVLPWQIEVAAPAMLVAGKEQVFYAHVPATVQGLDFVPGKPVKAGETLLRLSSPELEQRLQLATVMEANWRQQLEQQAFSSTLLQQGDTLRHHWEEAQAQLQGIQAEINRLTLTAPFDGMVMSYNTDLSVGSGVAMREPLLIFAEANAVGVDAFIDEESLGRVHIGDSARFIPEAPGFAARHCRIANLDRVNMTELDEPALASVYGGHVAVRADNKGALLPVSPLFRVHLEQCSPSEAPAFSLRGTAHLEADGRSPLMQGLGQLLRALIREAGL